MSVGVKIVFLFVGGAQTKLKFMFESFAGWWFSPFFVHKTLSL